MGFLAGKRLLITGVLSNRSIAYGIAKACHEQGAELAFSYVGERFKDRITEFAADFGSAVRTKWTCSPLAMMSATDPKRTFPSPQLSGYTNIVPPARKTKSGMEMSKRCGGSTVSSLICGEV